MTTTPENGKRPLLGNGTGVQLGLAVLMLAGVVWLTDRMERNKEATFARIDAQSAVFVSKDLFNARFDELQRSLDAVGRRLEKVEEHK